MRLLVCGSRNWTDRDLLESVLEDEVYGPDGIVQWWNDDPTIVQGNAAGADRMAKAWAEKWSLRVEDWPASWEVTPETPPHAIRYRADGTPYDVTAGHERNRQMLYSGVDGVLAFSTTWPATSGTAGMCRLAYDEGLAVVFVTPDGERRHFFDQSWTTRPERAPEPATHGTQGTLL